MRYFLALVICFLLASCEKTFLDPSYKVTTTVTNRLNREVVLKLYERGHEQSHSILPGQSYTDSRKCRSLSANPLATFDSARLVLPNNGSKLDVNCSILNQTDASGIHNCTDDLVSLFSGKRYRYRVKGREISWKYNIDRLDSAEIRR